MYTIGQVSQMTGLPISTLRYYDKVGLFSDLKRENGIRKFDDHDLDRIKTIECMKRSGLEIKDIKQYLDWCEEGESTLEQRLGLFERQLEVVEGQLEQLERTRSLLLFKRWFYRECLAGAREEDLLALRPDGFPPEAQALYDHAYDR